MKKQDKSQASKIDNPKESTEKTSDLPPIVDKQTINKTAYLLNSVGAIPYNTGKVVGFIGGKTLRIPLDLVVGLISGIKQGLTK